MPDCENGCYDNDEAWASFDECVDLLLQVSAGDISVETEDGQTSDDDDSIDYSNAYET